MTTVTDSISTLGMEGSLQRFVQHVPYATSLVLVILILWYPMGLVKLIYIALFGLLSMLLMFPLCYSLISQPPYLNANPFPTNSLTEAKLDLVIALVVLTGCWYGQKNLLKKSVRKLVLMMENFTVDRKGNWVFCLQCMTSIYLYIFATSSFSIRLLSIHYVISLWTISRGSRSTSTVLFVW